jgi:hypothetical protein
VNSFEQKMVVKFGLNTIFTILTLLCIALGWYRTNAFHATTARRHDAILRDWVQPLAIEKPALIYHRALPTQVTGLHRWKIHIPAEMRYELQCFVFFDEHFIKSHNDVVVARVAMPTGESVFEVDWRRDRRGMPIVRIAVLRPGTRDSQERFAIFPQKVSEFFSRTSSPAETIRGWEASNYASPATYVDFLTQQVPFRDPINPQIGRKDSWGGFQIRLSEIDEKPSTKMTN